MLSAASWNRNILPFCTWRLGKKLLTHYTQSRPKSATSPDHPSTMLLSGGALKPNATGSAKPVKKGNKKSLLAGKSPRLNNATKSSLVFEDHFIDCVRPFQSFVYRFR